MTLKERKNPDLIKALRKKRIASGAGVTINDVNKLLKQFEQLETAMKKMKKMGFLGSMMSGKMPDLSSIMGGNNIPPFKR
ncbi:MAG: Signal recognition particle protein [Alphaproteobacteria bacterium ADurb.Bin438]|nr:MAG: Signal recognition particle protein [Alphaproteobacteria bacterium ADurb.Bin438]